MSGSDLRPKSYGWVDKNNVNSYTLALDIPESASGYNDGAIPPAEKYNMVMQRHAGWAAHLDARAMRSEHVSGSAAYSRISSGSFAFTPAAGLEHAIVGPSAYVVAGFVVDYPVSRAEAEGLSKFTFTANKWTHWYINKDGIRFEVVTIGVAATPGVGEKLLGTAATNGVDLTGWAAGDAAFTTPKNIFAAGASFGGDVSVTGDLTFTGDLDLTGQLTVAYSGTGTTITGSNGGAGSIFGATLTGATSGQAYYAGSSASSTGALFSAEVFAGSSSQGLYVYSEGSGAGAKITMADTGVGLEISTYTGQGITVNASNATGMTITAGASQIGMVITGDNSATRTLSLTGSNQYCLQAIAGPGGTGAILVGGSTGSGAGVLSGTSPGGHALDALARNSTGHAVLGTSHSTSTAAAGRFIALDAAPGVYATSVSEVAGWFVSTGNYALRLTGDTTAPVYGTIIADGQNARPTTVTSGQLTFLSGEGQWAHSEFADSGWRGFWSSPNGYACAYSVVAGGIASAAGAGTYTTLAVITASAGNAVKVAGAKILIRLSMNVRTTVAGANTVYIRVQDTTGAPSTVFIRTGVGTGDTNGYLIPAGAGVDWYPMSSIEFEVTVPAAGTRQYTLAFAQSAGTIIRARDICLAFVGTVG